MDFIVLDSHGREKGYLPDSATLDFELGTDSGDLQLVVPHGAIEQGDFVVCYGTEYGAVMEQSVTRTDTESETWYGNSFRKLLEQIIIAPPKGQDYRTVSGDANTIIRSLLAGQLGGFFSVPSSESGVQIKNFTFTRYCTFLAGISDMLSASSGKLKIEIGQIPFRVTVSAAKVRNFSDQYEFSEDGTAVVTLTENRRGINHLICLGSGHLKDRLVLDLYGWPDGSVKESPFYTGFHMRSAVYDYGSAESADELKKQGAKQLQELMNKDSASVSVSGIELDIGDIVSGRSYGTGRRVEAPIVSKIIQIKDDGDITINYKTKGES